MSNPSTLTNVQCTGCGITIIRAYWQLARRKEQFCTRKCYFTTTHGKRVAKVNNPNWKLKITVECDTCGCRLQRSERQLSLTNYSFCNKTCRAIWASYNFTGENSPLWLGGHKNYRGANWLEQSRLARKRDNYICQKCGVHQTLERALDVHHIEPFNTFDFIPNVNKNYIQANDLSNLITLCKTCHKTVEWDL
jgi:hypothetical protein